MALKITKRDNRYLARLVTGERKPCAFCLREVDEEVTYGKLYAIGDIQCHYFCCLLSCCLIQKGHDEEGLFGFRYADILAEVERCKKHKCSYCGRNGANLGCSVGVCRKQFHLPCGREKNAISLYYGTYKSFCQRHAPKQKIPDHIMANARLRKRTDRVKIKNVAESNRGIANSTNVDLIAESEAESSEDMVCVICYETVDGFPTIHTFWPPCCARDAWFHRSCLQRMALSAGMHYLKCPLCNDKDNFHEAVVSQGYYVPDRDAAWELEQNAFAEIYERPVSCCADSCTCPNGREHDAENGIYRRVPKYIEPTEKKRQETRGNFKLVNEAHSKGPRLSAISHHWQHTLVENLGLQALSQWDIKLCLLCGSAGIHAQCFADESKPAKEDMSLQQIQNDIDGGALSLDESGIDKKLSGQTQPSTEQAQSLSQSQPSTAKTLSFDQLQQSTVQDQALDLSEASTDQAHSLDESHPSTDRNASPTNQSQAFPLRYVCRSCKPAAPEDLNELASSIEAIIQQEQAVTTTNTLRLVMPSRMSLRRTKGRPNNINKPSSSRYNFDRREIDLASPNVRSSRQELNLKTPRKASHNETTLFMDSDNKIMCSPVKLLEQSFKEKVLCTGVRDVVLDESVIETLRRKFRKPRPLSAKKKIVNNILDGVFDSLIKDTPKHKEQIKEWCSPKKSYDAMEVCEEPQTKNINNTTPTTYQDKENDSNTSNTPFKEINIIKAPPTENDSNYDESEDIKKTPTLNMEGHYRRTRNSLFRTNVNEETENTESPRSIKDKLRNSNCIPSPNNAEDKESKSVEISTKSISEDFGNTKDSFCKEETETDINDTPTKNVLDTLRKTRSSLSKTFDDKLNSQSESSSIDKVTIMSENEITPKRNTAENCRKTRNSTSKTVSIDSDNSKTDITPPTEIVFHFNTPEKQLAKPKISLLFTNNKNRAKTNTANTPVKKTTKDLTQKVSKYSKMIEDTKRHDAFLRNLINEENLCAKLLSELTRNQNNIDLNETPNMLDSSNSIDANNLMETSNELIESSNNIAESPNGLVESPNILVESANQIIETPKRKTIDIKQDSSLEISENDQSINIDVIKVDDSGSNLETYKNFNVQLPDKSNTCAFKFSPVDKETLKNHNVGIDMESFKKEYLCEVDREFKCNLKPDIVEDLDRSIFPKAIDFASLKSRGKKRKTSESGVRLLFDNNVIKRRKTSESDLKLTYNSDVKEPESSHDIVDKSPDEELKKKQEKKSAKDKRKKRKYNRRRRAKKNKRKSSGDKNIEVTIDSSENRGGRNKKIRKKIKTKFAIRNENIHVKIKWKKKQLSLNIESKKQARTEKKQKIIENASKMKQYVLQFPEGSSKEVLVKPEKEVCKLKRKYVRQEKCLDKLKQMSIHSFFKIKSPEN